MEVANPQRMGDAVPLVNPTRIRSADNPNGPPQSRSDRAQLPKLSSTPRMPRSPLVTSQHPPFTTQEDPNVGRISNPPTPAGRIGNPPYVAKQERVMGIEPTPPAWKAGALPLSYTRGQYQTSTIIDWTMAGAGFEPAKALPPDLQSGPFGHSGIPPNRVRLANRPLTQFSQTHNRHNSFGDNS